MKTAILILTPRGLDLARRYRASEPDGVRIFGPTTLAVEDAPDLQFWPGSLRDFAPEVWRDHDAIIAVMALGIVVRLFGPLALDKKREPALVAIDEAGRFAISVLGGHGGANRLAEKLARILGAQAVVTTASESAGLPAVDLIGRNEGWIIEKAENLTRVAAEVVRGEPVAVWQEAGSEDWWRPFGDWPEHFRRVESVEEVRAASVLFISDRAIPDGLPEGRTLVYRPPSLVAGIGCRRGTSCEVIASWVESIFGAKGLSILSLGVVATVMLKIDEPGLIAFAKMRGVPLVGFPSEQIADHPGIETPSAMVQSKVGLWGVAEPCALIAAGASHLLVPKQKGPGVTLALARRPTT